MYTITGKRSAPELAIDEPDWIVFFSLASAEILLADSSMNLQGRADNR